MISVDFETIDFGKCKEDNVIQKVRKQTPGDATVL